MKFKNVAYPLIDSALRGWYEIQILRFILKIIESSATSQKMVIKRLHEISLFGRNDGCCHVCHLDRWERSQTNHHFFRSYDRYTQKSITIYAFALCTYFTHCMSAANIKEICRFFAWHNGIRRFCLLLFKSDQRVGLRVLCSPCPRFRWEKYCVYQVFF